MSKVMFNLNTEEGKHLAKQYGAKNKKYILCGIDGKMANIKYKDHGVWSNVCVPVDCLEGVAEIELIKKEKTRVFAIPTCPSCGRQDEKWEEKVELSIEENNYVYLCECKTRFYAVMKKEPVFYCHVIKEENND